MRGKLLSILLSFALLLGTVPGQVFAAEATPAQPLPGAIAEEPASPLGFCGLARRGDRLVRLSKKGEKSVSKTISDSLVGIIDSVSPEQAEDALARALSVRLSDPSKAVKYIIDADGRKKLTPLGCKALPILAKQDKNPAKIKEKTANPSAQAKAQTAAKSVTKSTGTKTADGKTVAFTGKSASALSAAALSAEAADKLFDGGSRRADSTSAAGKAAVKAKTKKTAAKPAAKKITPAVAVSSAPVAAAEKPAAKKSKFAEILKSKPPANAKGKAASIIGSAIAVAGTTLISMMTQGVAVGAYVGMGTMFKAMGDNADRFGKAKPVLEFMKKHSHAIRIATAGGLMGMGLLTLNPIPTFIGMKFAMMGITGALCKISMNLVKKIIKKPEVEGKFNKVVDKVFGILNKPPQKVDPDKKPSKIRTALGEAKKAIYANRRNIAMIGITAGVENILQGVFGATTKLMWGKTLGSMTLETGNLSFMDKSKNTLIGAYRYYNLPSTALKRGANTKQFYEEIKTKYNPATAAEWGAAVDKEVKLASVKDLYGSPMAYITSEDAAKVLTFNGVSGRYADTAGKAALLQNMLKMSGLSKSNKIVIGMPEAGSGVTYAWVTDSDVLGNKSTELYRFDSAGNAVERLSPGKGINNEIVRSASKGFYGNIMTDQVLSNLIYKGIEGIANKMLGVKQKREEKKEQKEQLRAQKEMLKAQQVQPQILPEPELSAAAG